MTARDFVALSQLPSARRRASRALAALPPKLLEAPDALELLAGYCAREEQGLSALVGRLRFEADGLLEQAQASGLGLVTYTDRRVPGQSPRDSTGASRSLWVAGRVSALSPPVVAVVGSRAASTGGTEVAERLGHDLAAAGVTVVSGLARGCDAAAHRGALAAGGPTIAVLGCGADVVYPAEHRRAGPAHPRHRARSSPNWLPVLHRCRRTFLSGTASSAGSPWASSWLRRPTRAAPSSRRPVRSSRGGT